ncbi:MAG: hypothetical protein QOE75_168 [Solirubrobacterales bacterium]|jgi:hypothetical protein|nr:hypothetical protein [Solirubrobacterales bacterium]
MNFLKKGPEIKLSGIKVPGFVEDVYYDLKDRHLLPVAAILLVALVAVPIAIGGNSGTEEGPGAGAPEAGASQLGAAQNTGALVAEAAPGLREYKRRLDHGQSTDPFYNESASADESGGEASAGEAEISESGGGSSTPSESFTFPESSPSESGGGGGGGGTTTESRMTYYSMAIDVRITGGSGESRKTTVRKNQPELTMLPSRETPAIVYMGSTKDAKKAVMTVSSDVQAIYGDAKCALGSETCQLLVMEVGMPVTFVYGGAGKTYKIELLKVHLVESDKVNKAPLGDGDKKKGKKNQSLTADSAAAMGPRQRP